MGVFIKAMAKCDGWGYGNECEAVAVIDHTKVADIKYTASTCEILLSVREEETTVCHDDNGSKNTVEHIQMSIDSHPPGWTVNLYNRAQCPTCTALEVKDMQDRHMRASKKL